MFLDPTLHFISSGAIHQQFNAIATKHIPVDGTYYDFLHLVWKSFFQLLFDLIFLRLDLLSCEEPNYMKC